PKRETAATFRDVRQFDRIRLRIKENRMRSRNHARARRAHVQGVWRYLALDTIFGYFLLSLDPFHEDFRQPERRAARTVGLLAVVHFMDERIIVGRVLHEFGRRSDNP